MEIEVAMDPIHDNEPQDDRDHLLEIDEILERVDVTDAEECGEEVYQQRRYDLCPQCYRKFVASPLGREKQVASAGLQPQLSRSGGAAIIASLGKPRNPRMAMDCCANYSAGFGVTKIASRHQ